MKLCIIISISSICSIIIISSSSDNDNSLFCVELKRYLKINVFLKRC